MNRSISKSRDIFSACLFTDILHPPLLDCRLTNIHTAFVVTKHRAQLIPDSTGISVAVAPSTSALFKLQVVLARRSSSPRIGFRLPGS